MTLLVIRGVLGRSYRLQNVLFRLLLIMGRYIRSVGMMEML